MRTKEELTAVADEAQRAAAGQLVVIDETAAAYYEGVEAALRWATGVGTTLEVQRLVDFAKMRGSIAALRGVAARLEVGEEL